MVMLQTYVKFFYTPVADWFNQFDHFNPQFRAWLQDTDSHQMWHLWNICIALHYIADSIMIIQFTWIII